MRHLWLMTITIRSADLMVIIFPGSPKKLQKYGCTRRCKSLCRRVVISGPLEETNSPPLPEDKNNIGKTGIAISCAASEYVGSGFTHVKVNQYTNHKSTFTHTYSVIPGCIAIFAASPFRDFFEFCIAHVSLVRGISWIIFRVLSRLTKHFRARWVNKTIYNILYITRKHNI